VIFRDRGYYGAKSRIYDETMKKAVKRTSSGNECYIKKKGSAQKELK
jgi:hypothetical protein